MRLVLFDCDGTLVDSQHMIVAAMNGAFESVGIEPPSRTRTLSIVGRSLHEAMADLTDKDHPIEEMVAAYKKSFFELRSNTDYHEPLYDGALECLEMLAKDDRTLVGIATGKSRRGMDAIIKLHGLEGQFATIQTADSSPSKPNPGMVFQALEETGVSAHETVLIGDTSFDMTMAANANIVGLGVTWGYHDVSELKASGAAMLFDNFAQLQSHLVAG